MFRPIKGICGFSRETVIAVTTNIESNEYRKREAERFGYPEHPRAGTSDDVEAIHFVVAPFPWQYIHHERDEIIVEESPEVNPIEQLALTMYCPCLVVYFVFHFT